MARPEPSEEQKARAAREQKAYQDTCVRAMGYFVAFVFLGLVAQWVLAPRSGEGWGMFEIAGMIAGGVFFAVVMVLGWLERRQM